MGEKPCISPDMAQSELDGILDLDEIDDVAFARAHFCMRVLGCPVANNGKFAVIEDQPGDEARNQWLAYEDSRDLLKEKHDYWLEMFD